MNFKEQMISEREQYERDKLQERVLRDKIYAEHRASGIALLFKQKYVYGNMDEVEVYLTRTGFGIRYTDWEHEKEGISLDREGVALNSESNKLENIFKEHDNPVHYVLLLIRQELASRYGLVLTKPVETMDVDTEINNICQTGKQTIYKMTLKLK